MGQDRASGGPCRARPWNYGKVCSIRLWRDHIRLVKATMAADEDDAECKNKCVQTECFINENTWMKPSKKEHAASHEKCIDIIFKQLTHERICSYGECSTRTFRKFVFDFVKAPVVLPDLFC